MDKLLIRCSSLSAIMADPASYPREAMTGDELAALSSKKRTPEQVTMLEDVMARTLSAGAKSEVHRLVRYHIFGYEPPELGGKEIRKGKMQENIAIETLSIVRGEMYTKNEKRLSNEWITGEPDLLADDHGADTKCPWSLETFPLTREQARAYAVKSGYDWQVAGYMWLSGKPRWTVDYVMVDTPSELMAPWDDSGPHDLSGIPIEHRVTSVEFARDLSIEAKIKHKCEAAQRYAKKLMEQFYKEHS